MQVPKILKLASGIESIFSLIASLIKVIYIIAESPLSLNPLQGDIKTYFSE